MKIAPGRRLIGASLVALITISGACSRATAQHARTSGYDAIDARAIGAPPSVQTSFKSLGAWLTGPYQTDEEKTRAIFRWITENIDYDVEALLSGRAMSGSAQDALRNKRGVCEGYAGLFLELARASGIKAVEITGYAKGYGYVPGQTVGSVSNHAWNAVNIGGQWKLLDCTWGAGYIADDRRFHRAFEPHFFLTPPGEFVFDHFPEKEEWQLLHPPVSRGEFERTVHVKPDLFNLGISLGRNTIGTLQADGEIVLRLGLTRPVSGVVTLSKRGAADDERYAFVQDELNSLVIRVTPPDTGMHTLRLYAKATGDTGMYAWILDYRIASARRAPASPVYPKKFREFDGAKVRLIEPMRGVLAEGSAQKFRLRIPWAEQAAVVVNDDWTMLGREGEEFTGDVRIQQGSVQVCAKYAGRQDWDTLLEYKGK